MKLPSLFAALDAARSAVDDTATPAQRVRNAEGDHPNGSLSADQAWRMGLFGARAGWGPSVTDTSALQVGTVYACLAKLAGAISQLPVHEYRQRPSRERIEPASPLWWLLNESPDPAWTASAWKQWIVRCVKLRGDQHTEILRRGVEPVGLRVHHPDNVVAKRSGGRLIYSCRDAETGRIYGVDQDDMLHFTGFGFDGERSMSAIKWAARNAVATELAAAAYVGKSVAEGGMPRVALEYPNALNEKMAAELRENYLAIYGSGQGAQLPLVLAHGGKAHELSISPVDMELLATRKLDKQTICEVMGVPPIIIGDSEKASSWGTGIEQVILGWVKFEIAPLVAGWEEELNRKFFRRAGRYLEFSFESLLRGDSKSQGEAFRAALGGPGTGDGWLAVNEVRKLLNRPPTGDPLHDKPFTAQRNTASQEPTTP